MLIMGSGDREYGSVKVEDGEFVYEGEDAGILRRVVESYGGMKYRHLTKQELLKAIFESPMSYIWAKLVSNNGE